MGRSTTAKSTATMTGNRHAWALRASACSMAAMLSHSVAHASLAGPDSALEVFRRSSRAQDEQNAWYPSTVVPLSALLTAPKGDQPKPKTIALRAPGDPNIRQVVWMDSRYLIFEAIGSLNSDAIERNSMIYIADTSTGTLHPYKPGRLICYWQGKIIYETGPELGFSRPDVPGAQYWSGTMGSERPRSVWSTPAEGKKPRRLVYAQNTCDGTNTPEELRASELQWGGAQQDGQGAPTELIWKPIGLLPEHGIFANHLPSRRALPYGEPRDAYNKVEWFKPDGSHVTLPLSFHFEIGPAERQEWAPWLGTYVFSGAGLSYSTAPSATRTSESPSSTRYGRAGNVVLFNPKSSEITKVPRPPSLLNTAQLTKAWASRAGVLWQANSVRPWGIYLSQGEQVHRISERHVVRMTMSPDGCQAAVLSYERPILPARTNQLELIQFCTGSTQP